MKLPEIRSAMYKAFTAGQISEAEAEELDSLINAKAAIPAAEATPEQAVLAVVAVEVKRHGTCTLTVGHLAALAGVSDSTVRNALRQAQALCLVTIEERRRTAWMNYPNKVCIVSREWAAWLRLTTGTNSQTPRQKESKSGLVLQRENISSGRFFRQGQDPAEPETGIRQSRSG
jgi:hypothetical protein